MSRNEQAVASDRPGNLKLLERLDANVKAKAKRVVHEAVLPHEKKIVDDLVSALAPVAGHCRVFVAQRISDAIATIKSDAERQAYTRLVDETINAISDGKPVDLT